MALECHLMMNLKFLSTRTSTYNVSSFAAKVVPAGRTVVRRMIDHSSSVAPPRRGHPPLWGLLARTPVVAVVRHTMEWSILLPPTRPNIGGNQPPTTDAWHQTGACRLPASHYPFPLTLISLLP